MKKPDIRRTGQISTHGVKCIVYGKSGAGKTVLCSTAPSPLIISAEKGLLSLTGRNVPYVEVKTRDDIREVYDWLSKSSDAKKYVQTVCLDSLSEIAEVMLAQGRKLKNDPRQAYGFMNDAMVPLVKDFRDLTGMHVVLIAKETVVTDGVAGFMMYGPHAPGKQLPEALPYLVDEVFYLGIGKNAEGQNFRYVRTQPDAQYSAKDRSGRLAEIEYPDLTSIFAKIEGRTPQG